MLTTQQVFWITTAIDNKIINGLYGVENDTILVGIDDDNYSDEDLKTIREALGTYLMNASEIIFTRAKAEDGSPVIVLSIPHHNL